MQSSIPMRSHFVIRHALVAEGALLLNATAFVAAEMVRQSAALPSNTLKLVAVPISLGVVSTVSNAPNASIPTAAAAAARNEGFNASSIVDDEEQRLDEPLYELLAGAFEIYADQRGFRTLFWIDRDGGLVAFSRGVGAGSAGSGSSRAPASGYVTELTEFGPHTGYCMVTYLGVSRHSPVKSRQCGVVPPGYFTSRPYYYSALGNCTETPWKEANAFDAIVDCPSCCAACLPRAPLVLWFQKCDSRVGNGMTLLCIASPAVFLWRLNYSDCPQIVNITLPGNGSGLVEVQGANETAFTVYKAIATDGGDLMQESLLIADEFSQNGSRSVCKSSRAI